MWILLDLWVVMADTFAELCEELADEIDKWFSS